MIWLLVALLAVEPASPSPVRTNVCELLAHPDQHVGRAITIQAGMDLGRHVSLLMDEGCREGRPFRLTDAASKSPEWRWVEYQQYGRRGLSRLSIDGIRTEVSGMLRMAPNPMFPDAGLLPYLEIETFNGIAVPPVESAP